MLRVSNARWNDSDSVISKCFCQGGIDYKNCEVSTLEIPVKSIKNATLVKKLIYENSFSYCFISTLILFFYSSFIRLFVSVTFVFIRNGFKRLVPIIKLFSNNQSGYYILNMWSYF